MTLLSVAWKIVNAQIQITPSGINQKARDYKPSQKASETWLQRRPEINAAEWIVYDALYALLQRNDKVRQTEWCIQVAAASDSG